MKGENVKGNKRIILVIGGMADDNPELVVAPRAVEKTVATQAQLDELVNGFTNRAKESIRSRPFDDADSVECYLLHEGRTCFATVQLPLRARTAVYEYFDKWQPAEPKTD